MQSESIESQLAEEKCLMEQKYASMLQQVLAEKQLVRCSVDNMSLHVQLGCSDQRSQNCSLLSAGIKCKFLYHETTNCYTTEQGSFKLCTICTLYTHIKPIILFPELNN